MKPGDEIQLPIETPDGEFIAHYSEIGLAGLDFPSTHVAKTNSTNAVSYIHVLMFLLFSFRYYNKEL